MENKQGELLLQRRPPVGIWGGLWSFPECAPDTNIPEWVINELSYNVIALSELESIRHTFSHYHLDILPVHVRIDKPKAMIKETDAYCWYSLKQGQRLGLPAPVKALLERL